MKRSSELHSYKELVETILERSAGVRLVAVDGHGGAGKSTFAERLASAADGRAFIVHTDDFASWDNPINWWPQLLERVIKPLAAGETGRFQRYDWASGRLAEWIIVPRMPIVVIEGVSSSRAEWRHYLSFAIWIETSRDTCLKRGLQRDGDEMLAQWEQWMAAEEEHFRRDGARDRADLFVESSPRGPLDPQSQFVVVPEPG